MTSAFPALATIGMQSLSNQPRLWCLGVVTRQGSRPLNSYRSLDGFEVPEDHRQRYDILWSSIGTDPRLALQTRRGTGHDKVPSLKGVWYRGPFEHNGSVATLEDWFDARRLRDDYVPTGFKGTGVKGRAIKGHPFGLELSPADRQALISFLKTL